MSEASDLLKGLRDRIDKTRKRPAACTDAYVIDWAEQRIAELERVLRNANDRWEELVTEHNALRMRSREQGKSITELERQRDDLAAALVEARKRLLHIQNCRRPAPVSQELFIFQLQENATQALVNIADPAAILAEREKDK